MSLFYLLFLPGFVIFFSADSDLYIPHLRLQRQGQALEMSEHRVEPGLCFSDREGQFWFIWALFGRSLVWLAKSQIPNSHADRVPLTLLPPCSIFSLLIFLPSLLFYSSLITLLFQPGKYVTYMECARIWGEPLHFLMDIYLHFGFLAFAMRIL